MSTSDVGVLLTTWGLGNLLGSLMLGWVADNRGRKLSLILSMILTIIFSVITCFMKTFWPFCVLRFFTAIAFGGILPVAVIYLSECLPDNKRGAFNMMMEIFRSVGLFLCTAIAFMANGDWRFLIYAPIVLVCIALYFMIFKMHESSRYMMYRNDMEGVEKYLNNMCKTNKKLVTVKYLYKDEDPNDKIREVQSRGMFKTIFSKRMCRTTTSLIMIWTAQAFGSGVFLWLPALMFADKYGETDIYVLMMVLSLVPVGGIFVASYFVDTLGRKFLLMMSALITGLSLLTFCTFPANQRISIIVFYVVFGVYSLFMKILRSVTYLYTPEVYSTSVRSSALAVMNVFDKFASIGQPMVMAFIIYTSF